VLWTILYRDKKLSVSLCVFTASLEERYSYQALTALTQGARNKLDRIEDQYNNALDGARRWECLPGPL
jgi:hypothetical protein